MTRRWYSVWIKENLYSTGSQILSIISGAAFAIIIPRVLGAESFGLFTLAFAFANLFLFFTEFGVSTSMMKLIPASIVKKEAATYYRLLRNIKYVLTLVSSAFLLVFSDSIASRILGHPELGAGVRVSALFLFSYTLYQFYDVLFVSVKKNRLSFIANIAFQTSRILAPLLLYYAYRSYTSILLGVGIASLIALSTALLLKRGLKVPDSGPKTVKIDHDTLRRYFFYGTVGYLGTLLVQWMDSIIAGVYVSPTDVGFYRVGAMWISVVWLFIPFSGRVMFTLYSEKTETAERDMIKKVYQYSLRYSLVIAFLIMTGIWLTSGYFIKLVYGSEYSPASTVLLIMSFMAVESSLNTVNSPLLQGIGRIGLQTRYTLLVGVLSTAGGIYASRYGINGIAIAVTSIRVISMLLLTAYITSHMKTKIEPGVYMKPILAAMLTLALLAPFRQYITSTPSGLAYAVIVTAVYILLAITLKAISTEEARKILRSLTER